MPPCGVPLNYVSPIGILFPCDIEVELSLEALNNTDFASSIDFPPLIESIICIPQTDLNSLVSLRGGNIHELISLRTPEIAAPVQLLVFGDL